MRNTPQPDSKIGLTSSRCSQSGFSLIFSWSPFRAYSTLKGQYHRGLQTVDTRVYSLCTLLTDGSGRIHPGYKGSGPLARAEPGWTSAISHVHGNFHAEAKISSLRSFPFHFQSPFIQEVIEYLSVKMRARKNAIATSPAGLEGHSRQTRLRLPCTPPGLVSFVRSAALNQSSPFGSAKAMITSPSTRLLPGSPPKAYTTYSFPLTT